MTLCLYQFLPRSRTILQVVVYIMSGATMCHLRQRADETSFLCHASSTDRRKNQVLWSHVKSWHLVFTFLGPWSCSTHCRKTKYVHVIPLLQLIEHIHRDQGCWIPLTIPLFRPWYQTSENGIEWSFATACCARCWSKEWEKETTVTKSRSINDLISHFSLN
jgi:hypothetical protein